MTLIAYLDPTSGSMILQIIAGGVAAAGVGLKLTWRRVLRILGIRKSQDQAEVSADSSR